MGLEQLFDGRAKNYASGRPGYAKELLYYMEETVGKAGQGNTIRVADVGSGTGKFSAQLLAHGFAVYGIEPNPEMRGEAERYLGGEQGFYSVAGTAENTGMESGVFDAVTCAQSFHWFVPEAFARECRRILRADGRVFLIWNMRDMDGWMNQALYRLLQRHCPAFGGFSAGIREDDERIVRFFGGAYEKRRWKNPIRFTEERFLARTLSSSYAKREGEAGYEEFVRELRDLFHMYERDGMLHMPNDTVVYSGTPAVR